MKKMLPLTRPYNAIYISDIFSVCSLNLATAVRKQKVQLFQRLQPGNCYLAFGIFQRPCFRSSGM